MALWMRLQPWVHCENVAATMEVTNPWDLRVQFLDAKKTQQTYSSSSVTIPDYGKEDPTWLEKIDTSSIHKLSF